MNDWISNSSNTTKLLVDFSILHNRFLTSEKNDIIHRGNNKIAKKPVILRPLSLLDIQQTE